MRRGHHETILATAITTGQTLALLAPLILATGRKVQQAIRATVNRFRKEE